MKCNQKVCAETATKDVYWPGKSEPLPMCGHHADQARGLMDIMGYGLVVRDMDLPPPPPGSTLARRRRIEPV